jgi:type VI secretion system secreted protein VgrG
MAKVTQKDRPIAVSSPLGDDVLLFRAMTANEQLGHLFQFDLDLLSEDDQINIPDILGQNLTVRLALPGDETRYFNGVVSRFSHLGSEGKLAHYQATVRPWLWFLTRTADCRIFQEMTVPDIIKEVFREHGFTDFEEELSATYRTWTYCVQYRETDFNFVSRLMEQEGIYYYFKHEESKHVLVLADSIGAHDAFPGYEEIPFFPEVDDKASEDRDRFFEWSLAQEVQPGSCASNDFDFEKPKADLAALAAISREHTQAEFEVYDYPGEYSETSDGDEYVRSRIEELHARYEQVQGSANARGLAAGALFTLTDCPREDQNREYLITSAQHNLELDAYGTGGGGGGELYSCTLTAIASSQQYRSPRTSQKPAVQGPQTAIVVGKSGEEIWTDKYGRVKVQFHWDRYGKADENSSCWVRVASVWAGKNWGGVQIPRIGQEVIVEFLEGDPDRPIITGRVYNADNMPPYDLPANQTQSGMKSRSSKEGSGENFNEIRFEDLKGEEEVYIHAEKDHIQITENDRTETVGANRSLEVGANLTELIKANKESTVDADHTEHVKGHDKVTVDSGQEHTVTAGGRTVDIVGPHKHTVKGPEEIKVIGPRKVAVTGPERFEYKSDSVKLTYGFAHDHFLGLKTSSVVGVTMEDYLAFKYTVGAACVLKKTADRDALKTSKSEVSATTHIKRDAPHVEIEGTTTIALTGGDIFIDGDSIKLKAGGTTVEIASSGVTINGKLLEK